MAETGRNGRVRAPRMVGHRGGRGGIPGLLRGLDALQGLRPGHRPHRTADGLRVPQRFHTNHNRVSSRSLAKRRVCQLLLLRLLDDGGAERADGDPVQHFLQSGVGAHTCHGRPGGLRPRVRHGSQSNGAGGSGDSRIGRRRPPVRRRSKPRRGDRVHACECNGHAGLLGLAAHRRSEWAVGAAGRKLDA